MKHSINHLNSYMAPFDAYSLDISALVVGKDKNTSMPIATLMVGQAPDNFRVSSAEVKTTGKYTYNSGTQSITLEAPSKLVYIDVRRSGFAHVLTLCLFLINWALTIGSVYIVLLVVIRKEGLNDAILLLPVTIVLIIPALRGLYAGSPPFGIFIGKSLAPDLSSSTDTAFRYIRLRLADDGSCDVLHCSVVHCYYYKV